MNSMIYILSLAVMLVGLRYNNPGLMLAGLMPMVLGTLREVIRTHRSTASTSRG